jgi:small-conductance mechanosensitive channel
VLVISLLLLVVLGVGAQEAPVVEPAPAATPTPSPTPIPAAEISNQAASTAAMLRAASKTDDLLPELEAIEGEFEKEREHLDTLSAETARRLEIDGPASVLEETEKTWKRIEARIDAWQNALKNRAEAIDLLLLQISEQRAIWQLTLSSVAAEELPPEVRQEVVDSLKTIDDTERSVRSSRDAVLTLQSRISRSKSVVAETLAVQRAEILNRRRGIVGRDSPMLWNAFFVPGVDGGPSEQVSAMWQRNSQSVREYAAENSSKLIRHLAFVVALAFGLTLLRRKAELWAQQDRSLDRTVRVLDRPVSASLIITVLFGDFLHPRAPSAWLDVLGLVLLFAMLRVLPSMVPKVLQPMAYLLALLYFLEQATRLAPDGNLIDRLLLLALSLTASATCWWVDRKLADRRLIEPDGWRLATRFGNRFALAAFVVGSLANIFGSVGFATLVTEGTLTSVFTAILIWVAVVLLRAVVRVVLLTQTAKKLGIVRLHADAVRTTIFKTITWAAVLAWVIYTLENLDLIDQVASWLSRSLGTEISFGEFTWVPGTVVLFILVVWLSFKLSQLIRFGLETDFLPRLDLPRGVPGAISKVTHYVVIVVGIMIAATAAGLDFSRINLIIGALGVGIGFGLQTVVNNFVSGLILLFERPVRVGDRVEVSQLSGVVTDIGMRASVVRTWQGAEVIVPNANLISSEVINWTLSDESHRIEIPIGVAYGTDPQTVIDLMVAVAQGHPEVSRDPEPMTLFLGFGESSLDFELRAWTGPDYLKVASELRVALCDALADAGIQIPFPQRDLHLRTVDDSVVLGEPGGGLERSSLQKMKGGNE